MPHLAPIEDILQYKNPRVLARFVRQHPEFKERSDLLFQEMLKYLWLCKKHSMDKALSPDDPQLNFECAIHREMFAIDEMWHTFILITKDYAEFCEKYFGEFVHHIPDDDEDLDVFAFETDLRKFLSYIYEHLGEDTVKMWFAESFE